MAGKGIVSGAANVSISVPNINIPKLKVVGTTTVKPCRFQNDALDGGGFSRSESNSYIEVEVRDACDLPLKEMCNICGEGGVVSARLVNGKAYAMSDPIIVGEVATNSDASITLRFESENEMEEVLGC